MDEAELVRGLLEEALNSGRTPEEVCALHPECLAEVLRKWLRIRGLADELELAFPSSRPTGLRERAGELGMPHELPRIPGYVLEAVIGHGGMGVVYRARHIKLDRVVAVKMLRSGDGASAKELAGLVAEAQAVAGLTHPHIVQVHDVGELHGLPYFTMEFVPGGSLAQKLAGQPQPAQQAAAWVSALAHAVSAAHERGIVHRDLKPGNVLVCADGTLKITDFGLARRAPTAGDNLVTGAALRVGTPSYMPPEQAIGSSAAISPTADVYSLGAVLYEMLTGRPPFRGESPAETERQVLYDDPVPPARLNPRTPRDLQTICLRCLQKSPERRYASARAMADDLDRFRRGEPILARPVGIVERSVKWVRRRPAQAALVGMVVLLIAGGFGTGLWYKGVVATRRAELAFRETESRNAIDVALKRVNAAIKTEAWDEADQALARAKERTIEAHSAGYDGQIAALDRAVRLARALELIRQDRDSSLSAAMAPGAIMKGYAAFFQDAGFRIEGEAGACAGLVRASPIAPQLLAALDDWASLAQQWGSADQCDQLLAIARQADPGSAWRDRFRDKASWTDREALLKLAADALEGAGGENGAALHQIGLLGVWLGRVGAADAATDLLRSVLRQRPGDFWMNWELGSNYVHAARFREAVAPLRAAMALRPENAQACGLLAGALSKAGDLDEGIPLFRRALALAPNAGGIRRNLVLILSLNGRWDEARAECAWWGSLDHWGVEARTFFVQPLIDTHRYEEALSVIREIREYDKDDMDLLGSMGICLMNLHRPEEANAALGEATRRKPETAVMHAWFSRSLFRAGLIDEAIGEELTALDRSVPIGQFRPPLGEQLLARGRVSEASAVFARVVREAPSEAAGWIGLARAQLGARLFADARTSLARAAALPVSAEQRRQVLRLAELIKGILAIDQKEPGALSLPAPALAATEARDVAEWNWWCAGRAKLAFAQFEVAFASDPGLLTAPDSRARFFAACAAIAAATLPQPLASDVSPEERARLCATALGWLSDERDAFINRRGQASASERIAIAEEFRSWMNDPVLTPARNARGFDGAAEADFKQWRALWDGVERDAALDNPADLLTTAQLAAARSDWRRAYDAYTELFRIQPDQDGELWFELAAAQVLAGDAEGYRRTCVGMIEAQPRPGSRIRAYHVARAGTLALLDAADLSRADEIGMAGIRNSMEYPWAMTESGALKYRAGAGCDEVCMLLSKSMEGDSSPGMAVLNWLWLALANDRAGKPAESRLWFTKAETWLERLGDQQPPPNGPSAMHLHNWLEAQVLRREARAALAGHGG